MSVATPIPLFDLQTPLGGLRDQLISAAARTLEAGSLVLGPEVSAFEREFADYVGSSEAIGVANGTDVITIGLRCDGRRRG